MATLTFPTFYHKFETIYPSSSTQVNFGNSYTFTAPPTGPDQRTFRLYFTGMKYYLSDDGKISTTINAETNVSILEAFYQSVRQYKTFNYTHPINGTVVVTFSKPLSIPKGVAGGLGMVEDFQVDFLESIL
ncbi:hypothetical protein [Telmatospirillum sp.]|uniref:hypothetical protein n=1 Tax=Telmatospirillum sp. TaxID=2079197 RepID=UPI00284F9A6F|nr:hypothetical protein [Telmatospirillum sp.]MDR3436438.1 hypothetical protein [Telmatospirillum sp.]